MAAAEDDVQSIVKSIEAHVRALVPSVMSVETRVSELVASTIRVEDRTVQTEATITMLLPVLIGLMVAYAFLLLVISLLLTYIACHRRPKSLQASDRTAIRRRGQ